MSFLSFLGPALSLIGHFVLFGESFPSISELIHLARCVKVHLYFNPGIVLIALSGTETNRRLNFILGLGRINRGLALIGFRTTGTRSL